MWFVSKVMSGLLRDTTEGLRRPQPAGIPIQEPYMLIRSSVRRFSALTILVALAAACGGEKAPETTNDTTPAPVAPVASNGASEAEYGVCATCHMANGEGMEAVYPPLAGSEIVNRASPNRQLAIIIHGLQGPITIKGTTYNNVMAPWGSLTDEQIAQIATYERTSWGNAASAVTAAQVAEVRQMTASRTTAWTIEELEAAVQ
jgi:mono/diheme cytochrome c family protein